MVTREQQEKWDVVMESLAGGLPPASFNTWFGNFALYSVDGFSVIGYETQNRDFVQKTIHNRYTLQLDALVKTVFGPQYNFEMLGFERVAPRAGAQPVSSPLNEKYTFDTFVTGDSNNLAYMAALAVAEQPSEAYNPLFIYGDVGLGKTHLMNAIGNFCIQQNPNMRILFTTAENMANELIETLRQKKPMESFRQKYRANDLLIVDDVQFLAKTTTTQEEFFHTFNELHDNGHQIVISSDRPPKEIPTLEERLRSRFEWGLTVDIRKPNFETRVAILKKKCDEDGIDMPYEVVEYIANHFKSSIRELEGALTKVDAASTLRNIPITLDFAAAELEGIRRPDKAREITPRLILGIVADAYGVSPDEILGKKRTRDIANARHAAIYLCRTMTQHSLTMIGREFSRDHSTIMSSIEKIEEGMKEDLSLRNRMEELQNKIREM